MAVQTSDKDTSYGIANKSIVRVHFCDSQQRYGFVNIDPSIIDKLRITSETDLTQEIFTTADGRRGILVLERTKN